MIATMNATNTRTVRKAALTALDQGALSAVNFAIGLAFIWKGSPEQYGFFTFYMSVYYMIAAAQNALVNAPLMVMSPRMSTPDAKEFERGIEGVLLISMIPVIVLVPLGVLLPAEYRDGNSWEFLAVAVCCLPLILRDFFRAEEFARSEPGTALRRDLIYASLALIGVLVIAAMGLLSGIMAFLVLSLASLTVVFAVTARIARNVPSVGAIRSAFTLSWVHSRWSLLGAMSSWMQANAFVFIPFFIVNPKQVAILAAARMTMTPIQLLVQSWSNVFRPEASKLLANDDLNGALRLMMQSTIGFSLILVVYATVVALILSNVPTHWIPPAYRDMGNYIVLWTAVSLVQGLGSNVSSLLQASLKFRELALVGVCVAITVVLAAIPLTLSLGGTGTLIAVLGGQVLISVLMTWLLVKQVAFLRRSSVPRMTGGVQ